MSKINSVFTRCDKCNKLYSNLRHLLQFVEFQNSHICIECISTWFFALQPHLLQKNEHKFGSLVLINKEKMEE
jgi:hypothetical protein